MLKRITLFGSKHWAECQPVKELLSENKIDFRYVDITESMFNLKRFLKYRDKHQEFDPIRKKNRVGIPVVMINNGQKFYFQVTEEVLNELK